MAQYQEANSKEDSEEFRRRKREKIAVIVIISALILFTTLEVNLIRVSHKLPFVNSIFFFGLMNLNVVLIMLLLFLVFRNSVKLILDQKKGKIGSRLRTRLVVIFLLFSIIPTVLLFTICAFYIKSSFDKWFSARIESTLQRSIEVVRNFYENAEKNAQHFSRKVAMAFPDKPSGAIEIEKFLQSARMDFGLDAVEFYPDPFSPRVISVAVNKQGFIPPVSLETLKRAFGAANECKIQDVGSGELVRCSAFIGLGKGVLFVNYFIPHGLASQLSEINLTYSDYKSDNPFNYPVKSAYFAILLMVTLLILFSAIWTGFYIAKRLTVPIEELSKGTEEIAQGNLDYVIPSMGKDELSKLIGSFNQMTQDLRQNKKDIELTHEHLKNVNSELEKRRKYIEVLLESVQSGVVSLDEHGRVSMMNEAASRLLRKPGTELMGMPYWALIPEEHRSEFREVLLAVYGNSRPVRREIRIKVSDEDNVTLLMTFSVLRDENRKPMGVVTVFDDVTEIQKMERMMAWREVAKRIAHEIKNPLTPIQLSVQRLRKRYLEKIEDDGTFNQSTTMILSEVESLRKLVNEFSAFARLPEARFAEEDLNQTILEAVNLFKAAHEKITFGLELDDSLPPLLLDRSQFKRVLVNLFDNAVSAMSEAGQIEVVTQFIAKESVVRLKVIDEGSGIDPTVREQLFEPYFSTKVGGTGLGLAIVQKIVADHQATIRSTGREPKGTVFVIEFSEKALASKIDRRRGKVSKEVGEMEGLC